MTLEEKMDLVIARLEEIEKKLTNTYTESEKQTMMTQDDHCSSAQTVKVRINNNRLTVFKIPFVKNDRFKNIVETSFSVMIKA